MQNQSPEHPSSDSTSLTYFVSGMWCSTCAKTVQEKALQIQGVLSAEISYPTKLLSVRLKSHIDFESVNQQICRKIESIGFGIKKQSAGWLGSFQEDLKKEQNRSVSSVQIGLVWFLAMWSSMIAFSGYQNNGVTSEQHYYLSLASAAFGLPAILLGIIPYARSGFRAVIFSRLWTLDLFIFIGGFSAVAVSLINLFSGKAETYADSGAMIIAFLLLTKKIESQVARKLSHSILYQINQFQDQVEVLKKDVWAKAKAFQIKKQDRILVQPGETLAFDGRLASPSALLNCHLLSGENALISYQQGDHLLAGAIAGSRLEMIVSEALGGRKIDSWAEAALISGGPSQAPSKLFIKMESTLTTAALLGALGLAALASLRGDGMAKSIEAFFIGVLIFCPCLFASIIPLSKQMASVTLLKIGVLLQRPEALYPLGQLQTIYLDKTGTLAAVESEFIPADPQLPAGEKSDLLGLLQELSVKTQHPILRNFSFQKQELANRLEEITEFPGFGVKAIIRDHDGSSQTLWLGRPDFVVAQTGIYLPQRDSIFPVLVLDQKVVGQLIGKAIFDEQAMKFIDQVLRFRSDLKIEILSGDPNPQAGQSWVAIQPERISYYGQLSPEQKAQRIGPNSLFVGDGLNDTLALAKATVSCRLGQRVLGFAPVDIQLQAPNLENILVVLRYAKKYKSIQWQTAMLAFSYNLIALTLAALGKFSPLGAVLAMLTSFLLLLLSSLRLLKIPRS